MQTKRFQQHIPSLHNGISRQSPSIRFPNQVSDARNVLFSVIDGAVKRPGTRHHIAFTGASSSSTYREHRIKRDGNEEYIVVYGRDATNMLINVVQVNNPRNRRQWISITGAAGSFMLTFGGALTWAITYSATPATMITNITAALEALSTVGAGNVTVANVASNVYTVDFNDLLVAQDLMTSSALVTLTVVSIVGTLATVTFGADTQTYLNSGSSTSESLRMLTITDTTIIVNKEVAVVTSASVGSYANTGLLNTSMPIKMVRTSLYPPTFALSKITYNTAPDASKSQKVYNATTSVTFTLTLAGQTTAAIPYNATSTEVHNALVALSNVGDNDVEVAYVDKVYSVFFTNNSGSLGSGTMTAATAGAGTITVSLTDPQSIAPTPFVAGSKIVDIIYHRGRLGFATDEWIVFSQPDDLYNFFRVRNDQVDPDDPIVLQIGSDSVTRITNLIPFRKGVLILTDAGRQFDLGGGDTFTAETATFTPSTAYSTRSVKPATLGDKTYFAGIREGFTPIWEYDYDDLSLTNRATDITAHVADLIPSEIVSIAGSDNNSTVLVLANTTAAADPTVYILSNGTGGGLWSSPSTWALGVVPNQNSNVTIVVGDTVTFDEYAFSSAVYVYRQFEQGDQRLQSAWSVYDFGGDLMQDVAVVDDTAYMLRLQETGGGNYSFVVSSLPLTQDPTPPLGFDWQPHMDHRHVVKGGTYSGGLTTWTLPVKDSTINMVVFMDGGAWYEIPATNNSGASVSIPSDWTTFTVVLGRTMSYSINPSRVFERDQQGNAIIDGEIEISKIIVDYRNAGEFTIRAASTGRPNRSTVFNPTAPFGTTTFNIDPSGRMTAWTMGRATDLEIFIESESAKPLTITSIEYHGKSTDRGV